MNKRVIQRRAPQGGNYEVEIDFGRGSRANKMYAQLVSLMPAVKQALGEVGRGDYIRILANWQRGGRYRIADADSWILRLCDAEWRALSLGLRHEGTKGKSMYDWMLAHRVQEFPNGYKTQGTIESTPHGPL